MAKATCSVEGCDGPSRSKGMCARHYNADWHRRNRDAVRARQKQYYDDNREEQRARCLANYHAEPTVWNIRNRKFYLMQRFGLTPEDYEEMLAAQNGVCAICGEPETAKGKRSLSVDHCHRTGKVRALLCVRCNLTLGKIGDSPELARRMASYLVEHLKEDGCAYTSQAR